MGMFGKRKATEETVATLRDEVDALRARLAGAEQARAKLDQRVTAVGADVEADRGNADGRVDDLQRRIDCMMPLSRRVEEIGRELADAAEQRAALRTELTDGLGRGDR